MEFDVFICTLFGYWFSFGRETAGIQKLEQTQVSSTLVKTIKASGAGFANSLFVTTKRQIQPLN